jgi:hypothetical protein
MIQLPLHWAIRPAAVIAVMLLAVSPWSPRFDILSALEKQETVLKPIDNSLGMTLVYVPPGTFLMGSPASEKGRLRSCSMKSRSAADFILARRK